VNAGKLSRDLQDYYFRKMNRNFNKFTPSEVDQSSTFTTGTQELLRGIIGMIDDMYRRARGGAPRNFIDNIREVIRSNFGEELETTLELITDGINTYRQSGVAPQPAGAGRKKVIKCGGQSQTHTIEKFRSSHPSFNLLPFPRLNDQLITTLPYPKPIGLPNPFHNIQEIPDARFFRKIGGAELYSHEPVMKGGQGVASRRGMQFGFPNFLLGPYPPRNTQDLKDLPRRFL
jgi:hypothetical protein